MQLLLIFQLFAVFVTVIIVTVSGQNEGKYRPFVTGIGASRRTSNINDGRYRPGNDGKYRPGNDGRYRPGGDGKYRAGNDGKYIHKDQKYVHNDVGGGQYKGTSERDGFGGGFYGGGGRGLGSFGGNVNGSGIDASVSGSRESEKSGSTPFNTNTSATSIKTTAATTRIFTTTTSTIRPTVLGRGTGVGGNGWKIIQDNNALKKDGYHYLFETENGILAEESGKIESISMDSEGLRSNGFYEYTGDDGVLYRVDYTADENGFVPKGDHIPKMPIAIRKLLAYLATKPPDTQRRK